MNTDSRSVLGLTRLSCFINRGSKSHPYFTPEYSSWQDSGGSTDSLQNLQSSFKACAADSPLLAITNNQEFSFVAVAGRTLLRIINVRENLEPVEIFDFTNSVKSNTNLLINDISWGHGPSDKIIASGATNGNIILWDVSTMFEHQLERNHSTIYGHARSINRLRFSSSNGNWLFSGSQDGTIKLWDIRTQDKSASLTFVGKAEAVRDLQCNPKHDFEFAVAFENGSVRIFDARKIDAPVRKWTAHAGYCLSIAWHSSGKFLASSGRDKSIKVWSESSKGGWKIQRTIFTPFPARRITWRNPHFQITSCSLTTDYDINNWDLRALNAPSFSFACHDNLVTDFIWQSDKILWSVGKDGQFRRSSVAEPVRSHHLYNNIKPIWSPSGDYLFLKTPKRSLKEFLTPVSDSFLPPFEPLKSGIIFSDDTEIKPMLKLANAYKCDPANKIESCQFNSEIAYKLSADEEAEGWKLLSQALQWHSLEPNPKPASSMPVPWDLERLIPKLIKYFLDIGKIHFVATILLLLGPKLSCIPLKQYQNICESYTEFLRRNKMFVAATESIRLNELEVVRSEGRKEVHVNFSCPKCKKMLKKPEDNEYMGNWFCRSCRKTLDGCFLCQLPIRSIAICCIECCHAGHIECMHEWFEISGQKYCAAKNCGHLCMHLSNISSSTNKSQFITKSLSPTKKLNT